MNKGELIKELSQMSKLTQKDCKACLTALTSLIEKSLQNGRSVNLIGFGKFEVKNRGERISYNPHTKTKVKLAQKKVPTFKAGKLLKDAVV